jgi:hypothetical protein
MINNGAIFSIENALFLVLKNGAIFGIKNE